MLKALPADGETLQAAQQREVYRYLAEHPDAPKAIAAYDWIVFEVIDPKPAVELPGEQYDQPEARDVTPRSPPPSPPRSSERSLPPAPGAGGWGAVRRPSKHEYSARRSCGRAAAD